MSARRTAVNAVVIAVVLLLLTTGLAHAHEFRPALLRLEQRAPTDADPAATGRFDLRLVAPALSSAGPLPEGELRPLVPDHCTLVARSPVAFTLDCGAQGLAGRVGVAGLDRHPVDVLVEIRYVDATRITAVLGPDDPTVMIGGGGVEQAWGAVVRDYLLLGVEHILLGFDHLAFVLGLVLLVRSSSAGAGALRRLLWTVTAFTVAHSVTLAASGLAVT
jgi:hypothetical protein